MGGSVHAHGDHAGEHDCDVAVFPASPVLAILQPLPQKPCDQPGRHSVKLQEL